MKQKIMLSEDNAISKEDIEETVLLSSADSTEKKEDEVSESSVATGILSLLNSLIIDEWEAIDGYNSTIESLSTLTGNYDAIISILRDIVKEEMIHVGQLQYSLNLISPDALDSIQTGEHEGKEQTQEEPEVSVEPQKEKTNSTDTSKDIVIKISTEPKEEPDIEDSRERAITKKEETTVYVDTTDLNNSIQNRDLEQVKEEIINIYQTIKGERIVEDDQVDKLITAINESDVSEESLNTQLDIMYDFCDNVGIQLGSDNDNAIFEDIEDYSFDTSSYEEVNPSEEASEIEYKFVIKGPTFKLEKAIESEDIDNIKECAIDLINECKYFFDSVEEVEYLEELDELIDTISGEEELEPVCDIIDKVRAFCERHSIGLIPEEETDTESVSNSEEDSQEELNSTDATSPMTQPQDASVNDADMLVNIKMLNAIPDNMEIVADEEFKEVE